MAVARPIRSNELLDLANILVPPVAGRGRPQTIRLRHGVSCAYYALFHALIGEATTRWTSEAGWRSRIGRWYQHGEMRQVSEWLVKIGDNLDPPKDVKALFSQLITTPAGRDTIRVAQTFVNLQDARHRADYDHDAAFGRSQVRLLIKSSQQVVDLLPSLSGDPHFELYLRLLLDGPGLIRRSR